MALCFLEQVYLLEKNDLEALCTQLDNRTIGNTSVAFHLSYSDFITSLFFSYFLAEAGWLSNWLLCQVIISNQRGSEPAWSHRKCSRVEKQAEENTIWVLSRCSFYLTLTVPAFFFSLASSSRLCEKIYFTNNLNVRNCEKGVWQSVAEVHVGICSWAKRGTNC